MIMTVRTRRTEKKRNQQEARYSHCQLNLYLYSRYEDNAIIGYISGY